MANKDNLTGLSPNASSAIDRLLVSYDVFRITYRDDPVAFVHDCFNWQPGQGPSFYQEEILSQLPYKRRISVRGPHGLGKTAMASWVILWFALTRDGAADWKVPTTASAWRQLTKFLWPEVKKWSNKINWAKVGREPLIERAEILDLSLKLKTGEAFALASDNSAMIEGAHADQLLYVFDESKEIQPDTWDSAEGAFSTGDCRWLSISTPGEPNGRFYEIQSRKPGYEDWWVRPVKLEETIKAGRVSREWANSRKAQWGETSAAFQNRVMGEFASSDEDGVIPLHWIELANERYYNWLETGGSVGKTLSAVGVDVARSGSDKTVKALRYDNAIGELRKTAKHDTMETVGEVKGILDAHGGTAVIDVIGIGAGVVDRLRELGYDVVAFNSAEHTDKTDASGELGFANVRSAALWNLREILNPDNDYEPCLPPDDLLTGDLTAPHWRVLSGGKILVESKEDIKERLGRSTDDGDAVMMAFWTGVRHSAASWIEATRSSASTTNPALILPQAGTWDRARRMG